MFANCNAAVTTDTVQFFSSSTLREGKKKKNIAPATKGSISDRFLAEGFSFFSCNNIHPDGFTVSFSCPCDPLEGKGLETVIRGLKTLMAGKEAALQKRMWGPGGLQVEEEPAACPCSSQG